MCRKYQHRISFSVIFMNKVINNITVAIKYLLLLITNTGYFTEGYFVVEGGINGDIGY